MVDIINIEQFSSIVRMIFCIIFFNKIYFIIKGFDFHWCHVHSIIERKIIYFLLLLTLPLLIMLFFGFFSKITAVFILLIYFYTFIRSSLYGLEDAYLSTLTIYVTLSNNFYFSLDKVLGLDKLTINSYFFETHLFPEMVLSLSCSLIFFSSTCEKLRTKIWRSGMAIKYFFIHPKFRKINLEFLGRTKFFSITSGTIVLMSQGLIFFSLFFPSKYGLLILFSLLVFTLMLSIFFLFVGLAEASILILLTQSFLYIHLWEISTFEHFLNVFYNFTPLEEYLSILILTLNFIYLINQFFSKNFETYVLKKYSFLKYVLKLPRYFLGLLRIDVFSEEHLSNPIAFRVFAHSKEKKIDELFQTYNDDGTPYLKKVALLPSIYLSFAYKIHDILIEFDQNGKISTSNRFFLEGYVCFLLKDKKIELNKLDKIIFKINQLNLEEVVEHNADLNKKMIPMLELKFDSNFEFDIFALKNKLLNYDTNRSYSKRYTI